MIITITNIYSGNEKTFQGDDAKVRTELLANYPFLTHYGHDSLNDDLAQLANTQAYMVEMEKWPE